MRWQWFALAAMSSTVFAGAACSAKKLPPLAGDDNPGGDEDAATGAPAFGASSPAAPSCAVETQFVYTVDADANLYRFDPPSHAFTKVGTLVCPSKASPYSMAVDRTGAAWVVYEDGTLFKVSTVDASCQATTFAPGQQGFTTFGMAFSSDAPDGGAETLFVSESHYDQSASNNNRLATIDLQTLELHVVGTYDKLNARAEMTGTGDARLFGAFEGQPYVVAEIDKATAKILSEAPQTPIQYPPNSSNLAFAFWGGSFYLFVGPGGNTDVFRYEPSDGTTTKIATVAFEIVGAGVSTCAPVVAPK